MSVQAIKFVMSLGRKTLHNSEKLVLLAIAFHCWEDEKYQKLPIRTLVSETACSRSTVERALLRLQLFGYLGISSGGPDGTISTYTLLTPPAYDGQPRVISDEKAKYRTDQFEAAGEVPPTSPMKYLPTSPLTYPYVTYEVPRRYSGRSKVVSGAENFESDKRRASPAPLADSLRSPPRISERNSNEELAQRQEMVKLRRSMF